MLLLTFHCVLARWVQEPWALRAHPELGFLTVIALGTEKTWLVVGTSRGFVMLWDLRFQVGKRFVSMKPLLFVVVASVFVFFDVRIVPRSVC